MISENFDKVIECKKFCNYNIYTYDIDRQRFDFVKSVIGEYI